jgi:mono/diheme cytochrome c family protein
VIILAYPAGDLILGRDKMGKSFVAVLVLFVFAVPSIAGDFDPNKIENPVKADNASISKGELLYTKHCSVCHGEKADGKGPSSDGFEEEPWSFVDGTIDYVSDGFLFQQIKNGGPWYEMPPFALGMKDEEIWNVINYMRSLNKK